MVLVAHDYRFELPVLRAVLDMDTGYVGLLGNRRRVAALFEHLAADGVPLSVLERVHAPVGLDIGARTPAEIAVAIIAEIIAVRRGRSGGTMRTAIVSVPAHALAERVTESRPRA